MADERRHESEDLEDYETLGSTDTLDGPPGDDPLDRGVVVPDHWSAASRFGATVGDQEAGESLNQLLAEEEPDITAGEPGWDENATEDEAARYEDDDVADPRAGRLVSEDTGAYEEGDTYLVVRDESVARDEGIDGGGSSAEESAVHVVDDEPAS